ncbi:MAG: hypothetical protein HUU37_10200 [Bdellovibrionales bacterium]|nr:hypothetical protein [Bdellovibrionales bacterium]
MKNLFVFIVLLLTAAGADARSVRISGVHTDLEQFQLDRNIPMTDARGGSVTVDFINSRIQVIVGQMGIPEVRYPMWSDEVLIDSDTVEECNVRVIRGEKPLNRPWRARRIIVRDYAKSPCFYVRAAVEVEVIDVAYSRAGERVIATSWMGSDQAFRPYR